MKRKNGNTAPKTLPTRRITKNSSDKNGLKPGTLMHVGNNKNENIRVKIINYNKDEYIEKEFVNLQDIKINEKYSNWIIVDGINNIQIIEFFGKKFNLHTLLLEDILNSNHRSKVEEHEGCTFIVLKMVNYNEKFKELEVEQISLVVGNMYLLSFLEKSSDVFSSLISRIKLGRGAIRKDGINHLSYSILDTVVDNYFNVLEKFEDNLETVEQELISSPNENTLRAIYKSKRELIYLRKLIWPLREIVNNLRIENYGEDKDRSLYLNDIYDHVVEITDTIQLFIDITTGMLDTYLSSVNNKMSEVMKVLTIFSAIFIPATFLAGVYGTNFEYIPELKWRYSYFVFWGVVLGMVVAMFKYFKKKNWF